MSAYDALSEDDLSKLIQELRDTLRRKRGQPDRNALRAMLSPDSTDFMGTGLTAQEFVMAGEIERLTNAYWRQDRGEQARRRDAAIALAVELSEVLKSTRQASLFGRSAVAAVINGDWKEVKGCRDILTFEGEEVGFKEPHQQLYAKFVALLDETLANVPKAEPTSDQVVVPN